MPLYTYRCLGGQLVAMQHRMGEAPREQLCPCCKGIMVRVYTPPAVILRPENYSTPPGDPEYWKGFGQPREIHAWQASRDIPVVTPDEARRKCGEENDAEARPYPASTGTGADTAAP